MLDKFFGIILISIAFLIGSAISYVAYDLYSKQVAAGNFLPVDAVITKSRISQKSISKGSQTYYKDVSFEYTVDGTKYTSNLWSFFGNQALGSERFGGQIASHPEGKKFKAFYNPKNPKIAVIDNTPPKDYMTYAITIFLVGFISFIIFCTHQMFFSINMTDIDKARKLSSIISRSVARR